MHVALTLVSLVAVVVVVTGFCRRYDLSAPIVLVVVGVAGSFLPLPDIELNADIVLIGLLPPLLYNAALGTSLIHFHAQRWAILSLSIGLVVFTTVGVAVVAHVMIPDLRWPAAFAIGAVVAPPDAVAATAVAKRIGLPRQVVTLLEGESLLNDATALVALRAAVVAVTSTVSVVQVGVDFVVAAVGGTLVGVVVYLVVGKARKLVTDPVIDTSISIVTPFVAYVLAEEVHASGVLAVVVAGLLLGHRAPVIQTASSRIAEQLTWRTVGFLLENAVFLLIGLQASRILGDVADSDLSMTRIAAVCLAVLVAVIVLRFAWVFPARRVLDRLERRERPVPPRYVALVGWAGMRGVVTLAAAFAIPPETKHREVLLLVALVVTAGTLLINGLTLPWLARLLDVPGPDAREDALARAELITQASRAGLDRLTELKQDLDLDDEQDHGVVMMLKGRLEQRDLAAWERLGSDSDEGGETPSETYSRIRLSMLEAERARVLQVRSEGHVPHEVVQEVLAALDVEESMIDRRIRRQEVLAERLTSTRHEAPCKHLAEAPDPPQEPATECEDCVREGTRWVHLRRCLECGHAACCDSSPRRHASAHHRETGHPVMASAEPGEAWRWCFVDEVTG
ncbi:Na+/H+ antiporter [Nocardioides marmoribigeumensis]|uniref:CPA1 family monovalent cation:H+ antiporter n=1 Tax=Nocardioides marmoribigeumensis TaxID=433649 RepID=A0ABU2BST7_9ACTN|nr:Na+/H+ antiporter [Nocardioides marmoribigeumensis]MDR7361695.1 CPA1 family monovalent cation:H+ antiporter [Nocardioides marmoribigeumensis]